ncbi:MAG: glycosyltransferase family 2 protein [Lysobacterales bacterium]|nr:MAG: glycosyltransferase family 2 protein [Xanthomonadales bacterium]
MKLCIVIPHYDHVDQFTTMLPQLAQQNLPLLVVDDHSPAGSFARLETAVAANVPGATLIRLDFNQGKGRAVRVGLSAAREAGYTHSVQLDADGQHDLAEIPVLAAEAERYPGHIVCGQPIFDQDIPAVRYYARYITLALSRVESISTEIRDAMCGFRVYPLDQTLELCEGARLGSRMDFDTEILVRAIWAGMGLRFVPVHVAYPEMGVSHFRYLRDNLLISWMHTRLLVGMLTRLPFLMLRKWRTRRRA